MRARKVIAAATGVLVALTTLTSGASAITGRHDDAPAASTGRSRASPRRGRRCATDGRRRSNLDPAPIKAAEDFLASWTKPDATGHPHFSGAVGLLAHDGVVVDRYAVGGALRYADATGTELPADQQVPMRNDTIFDMASISKLFTSIAVLQLVERGQLDHRHAGQPLLPGVRHRRQGRHHDQDAAHARLRASTPTRSRRCGPATRTSRRAGRRCSTAR